MWAPRSPRLARLQSNLSENKAPNEGGHTAAAAAAAVYGKADDAAGLQGFN